MANGRMDQPSCLDRFAQALGCQCLSDLHCLKRAQRNQLRDIICKIPAQDISLAEWNDILTYLTGATPTQSAEEARALLLAYLA